jgi:hypothetical protein
MKTVFLFICAIAVFFGVTYVSAFMGYGPFLGAVAGLVVVIGMVKVFAK